MKYADKLLQLGCFSFEEAVSLVGNNATAASMLYYYTQRGTVVPIRKGLYSAVNPLDKEPIANRFQIGTKLTDTAVISHHSAFEYHGYANQVSYHVYVSSDSKFNSFDFGGFQYIRIPSNINVGIETGIGMERVTDIERTVLDSINDFDKSMGFEELTQCISVIPFLKEDKIISYLEIYDKCFLWQKAGFIFEHFRNNFGFSDNFFVKCKKSTGNSSRYFLKDMKHTDIAFNHKWHLTYPKDLWNDVTGGDIDAEV